MSIVLVVIIYKYSVYFLFFFLLRFDHKCFCVITWHRKYFGFHSIHLIEDMSGYRDDQF